MRNFMICNLHQILYYDDKIKNEKARHVARMAMITNTRFWSENLKGQVADGMLKRILKEQDDKVWTGLIWIGMATSGGLW
jgi:hypothetical protein